MYGVPVRGSKANFDGRSVFTTANVITVSTRNEVQGLFIDPLQRLHANERETIN